MALAYSYLPRGFHYLYYYYYYYLDLAKSLTVQTGSIAKAGKCIECREELQVPVRFPSVALDPSRVPI
jgi:hypothetical protein